MSRMTIRQFAAIVGHDESKLDARLKADGIFQKFGRPYQKYIDTGYFIVVNLTERRCTPFLSPKGQVWLARRYPVGCDLEAAQ